jgi:hypothetical protein
MSLPDRMAIAAHLHVLLRRKTGRVTDTQWMATNREYAGEVIRLVRAHIVELGDDGLGEWADKLEQTMAEMARPANPAVAVAPVPRTDAPQAAAPAAEVAAAAEPPRYIGRLR